MIENVVILLVDIGVVIIKDILYRIEGIDECIYCIIIEIKIMFGKKIVVCFLLLIFLSCG